jgi:hypothetical protein
MRHALARSCLAPLALAAACTGLGPGPEAPLDDEPSSAVPMPLATVPEATPPDETEAPPSAPASPLHVVAVREGPIELLRDRDALVPVLDGEPLPLLDGVPTRGRDGSRGLGSSRHAYVFESPTLAFAGRLEPSQTAWLTAAQHFERATSVYEVYRNRNQGQGWELLDLRKGPLVAYYAAFVERGGALLGLRSWANDPEQDAFEFEDPRADVYVRAAKRATAKAGHGFVHLSGTKTAMPKVPARMRPFAAVASSDGTLHALAREHGKSGEEHVLMLVWPPGVSTAERVPLPGAKAPELELSASGEWVLAFGADYDGEGGRTSYLAVGRGTEWQQVPVSVPARAPDPPVTITGAARAADGELWITIGERWTAGAVDPLWRKPSEGPWTSVPLPELDGWFSRDEAVVFDAWDISNEPWLAMERPPTTTALRGTALVWADDAVWVVIEAGDAYGEDAGMISQVPRSLLLSTRPAASAPATLPPSAQLRLEQRNHARAGVKPGTPECEELTLLLGAPALVDQQPGVVSAVAALQTDGGDWSITQIYVGELDGAKVLAVGATALSPGGAAELHRAVAKVTGFEPTADCRIPTFERMVQDP